MVEPKCVLKMIADGLSVCVKESSNGLKASMSYEDELCTSFGINSLKLMVSVLENIEKHKKEVLQCLD